MKYQIWLDSSERASPSSVSNVEEIPTFDTTYNTPFPLPRRGYVSVVGFNQGTEISKYQGGSLGSAQDKKNLMMYNGFNCFSALTINLNVGGDDVLQPVRGETTWGIEPDFSIDPTSKPETIKKQTPIGVIGCFKGLAQNTAQFQFATAPPPTFLTSSKYGFVPLVQNTIIQPIRSLVIFNDPTRLRMTFTAQQKFQLQPDDGLSGIVQGIGKTFYYFNNIPQLQLPLLTELDSVNTSRTIPYDNSFMICLEIEPVLEIERPLRSSKWLWIESRFSEKVGELGKQSRIQQSPNYQGFEADIDPTLIAENYKLPTWDLYYSNPLLLSGLYNVKVVGFNMGLETKAVGEDELLNNMCYQMDNLYNSLYVSTEFSSAYVGNSADNNPDPPALTSDYTVPIVPLSTTGFYNLTTIGIVNSQDSMGTQVKYLSSFINGLSPQVPGNSTRDIFTGQMTATPAPDNINLMSKPQTFDLNPSQNTIHIVLTTNDFLQMKTDSPDAYENWRIPYRRDVNYPPSTAYPTPTSPDDNFYLPFDLPYQMCIQFDPC